MSKITHHPHPNPGQAAMRQSAGFALLLFMGMAVILQVVAALLLGLVTFFITALLTLALVAPVLMLLSATPPVTVSDEGLTIHPRFWRERRIAWEDVQVVRPYPLLPRPDQEVGRRALQGRKSYKPAEGTMLVVRGLPLQYRAAGWFAGERGRPVIAVTNRTHAQYGQLLRRIERHTGTSPQG